MSRALITLEAKIRQITGKKVKKLRKAGILPAVLYGKGIDPLNLELNIKDFARVFKEAGHTNLIQLSVFGEKGTETRNVLIHDVDIDPLKATPIHVDLYQVRMDEKVSVLIPIRFVGESSAVKNEGGILVKAMHELEVRALPGNIPEEITVDISGLNTFEDVIYVRDITPPEGVEIVSPTDSVIALVQPPKEEIEEVVPAAPELGEIITEAEEKRKARQAQAEEEL
jgi:large subunit ribosomal protein L25